ncbi:MAG: YaiO family outer membrane beta-barrel protein [Candidatus Ratteibacteria bacterium]|jgi:YaiO family outer membrane protein
MRAIRRLKIGVVTVFFLFVATFLFAEAPSQDFHFQNGVKLYLEGDSEAALVALRKSLEINPDSRETRELINLISGKKKAEPIIVAEQNPASPIQFLEPEEAVQQAVLDTKEPIEPVLTNRSSEPAVLPGGFLDYVSSKKITKINMVPYRNSLEADFLVEYLDPNDIYGSWESFELTFYRNQSDSLTYFLQGGVFWRDEGDGMSFGAGISKTWNKYLYTSSSVHAGTNVDYLPEINLSHGFYFKLGQNRNNVVPIGFTYIGFRNGHEVYVVSSGITVYRTGWIFEYLLSRNQNEPGSVISYSHLASVAHGQDGLQWLTLTLSAGQDAYLATDLTTPEEVNQDSYGAAIRLKRWLGKSYGVIGEISYFTLGDSYDKYGLTVGIFTEF